MTSKEKERNRMEDDEPEFIRFLPSSKYILADITADILNEIITYAARERIRERKKDHPNLQYMDEMNKLGDEAADLSHNPKNFAACESMIPIIKKYGVMSCEFSAKEQKLYEAHDPDIFEIPEDEFFRILHQEIIPKAVKNVTPQKEKATVIIIGGQPGSGKTTYQQKALEQLQGNAVICDIDALRDFHPNIQMIKKEFPDDYDKHTYTCALRWHAEVIKYCLHNKMNFIVDTTFTDGDWLSKLVDEIEQYPGEVKYQVRVKLLAVNPQVSRLGLKLLYEIQKARSKEDFVREVPPDIHDEKFAKIPNALNIFVKIKKHVPIDICSRNVEEVNGKLVQYEEEVPLKV